MKNNSNITTIFDPQFAAPPEGCQNCGRKVPTKAFAEGGVMAMVHGLSVQWCQVCILTRQLEFARERAAAIPELEKMLERATAEALVDVRV